MLRNCTTAVYRSTIPPVIIYVLSSGSCGNCTFVRSGNTSILVDAGLPGSTVKRYLERINESIENVDAMLITHEHRDHTRGAGVLSRRYGVDTYATQKTFEHSAHITNGIEPSLSCEISANDRFSIGDLEIESVSTPHDAKDSVGYIIEAEKIRFGVFTDFGHAFDELIKLIPTFDVMMLETNYDEEMLDNGPYPEVLRRRIRSDVGHMSNDDSAELIAEYGGERLKTVIFSHLSEDNNSPDCVLDSFESRLDPAHYRSTEFVMTKRGYPIEPVSISKES